MVEVKKKPNRVNNEHITTIQVLKTTRKRLNALGTKMQTYDDIINGLIDFMEMTKKNE